MIVPLFPLNAVLFPGGRLPLRIFEQRYMDMAKESLREGTPFGVCLIASGDEVAGPGRKAAEPHAVGTLARIVDWDMPQTGVLAVVAEGGERYVLRRRWCEPSGLLRGEVEPRPAPPEQPVAGAHARLVPLLHAIFAELAAGAAGPSAAAPAPPYRYADSGWVSMRYAEVLPIPAAARQKLLEIDDGVDRLEIIYRFLDSKGLLPGS